MIPIGAGEGHPIATNDTDAGRSRTAAWSSRWFR
jgi:outer membrane protein OmpA-like peptidoglycan-associated protein